MEPKSWQVGIILTIGVFAVSTSAIFIRLAMAAAEKQSIGFSIFLAASRLSMAALILLPTWRKIKTHNVIAKTYYYAIAAGICLAFHFAAWISSLGFTSIAASTTLVTSNPIWVALLSRFWFKEKLGRVTILGIIIALVGGITIALGNTNLENSYSNPTLGNILALIGAWMASLYLLLGSQAQKQGLSVTSYIAIVYTTAAIILLPFPFLFGTSYLGYSDRVYLYILLMALIPQLIGHTSFNWSLRWISPTFVTLSILFEPVVASFLGAIFFGEVPSLSVLVGGAILLSGVAIATKAVPNSETIS